MTYTAEQQTLQKRKPLTRAQFARLVSYDADTGEFVWLFRPSGDFATIGAWRSWNAKFAGKAAFSQKNANGYRVGRVYGQRLEAHRMAWLLGHGTWPVQCIDHVNGDRSDNRLCNLRDVSKADNARNAKRRVNCTSGATGVHWNKARQKWRAIIHHNGRCIHLGLFASFEDAATARREANGRYGFAPNHGRAG